MSKLTIFTATYNRGYILPMLYQSLCRQTNKDFEWIVIDDGSSDNTGELLESWQSQSSNSFQIRFEKQVHGGKQRAINKAVMLAKGDYFFIVDSDDRLAPTAVQWAYDTIPSIDKEKYLAGFSGIKCHFDGSYLENEPMFNGQMYIECSNIERSKYKLTADMAEIYKTAILKKYPFQIWHDETFTPENVVFDRIAIEGYRLRWYNEKIYLCEYRADGMVRNWDKLFKANLIGFAMDRNIRAHYANTFRDKLRNIRDIIVFCILKRDLRYLIKCDFPLLAILAFPLGYKDYLHFVKNK